MEHLHSVYHLGVWELRQYAQTRDNLKILFPNVPSMNNGPNEHNHSDNNLLGDYPTWNYNSVEYTSLHILITEYIQ